MRRILVFAAIALTLGACQTAPSDRTAAVPHAAAASVDAIKTIVVIYAENRAFDNLYGNFPGANGLQQVTPEQALQRDRDGKPLPTLPPVPGKGLTDPSDPVEITSEMTARLSRSTIRRATTSDSTTSCTISSTRSIRTRCRSTAAGTTASPPTAMPAAR